MNVAGPEPNEPTYPCKICGRKFVKSSLVKHEPACKIMSNPKRKPFESGVQRVKGSDLSMADVFACEERDREGVLLLICVCFIHTHFCI